MKRTSIVNYIMLAALVSVIIFTVYAWMIHAANKKKVRIYDDQDAVCIDCFNEYDHFYNDY